MSRITIIGLGYIGASLGLAMKQSKISNADIVGYDCVPDATMQAQKAGAVTRIEPFLSSAVSNAELVIIATPVGAVREILEQIAKFLPAGCTVTDTANTKAEVLRWASDILPSNVDFIGGHPLVKRSWPQELDVHANLFQERPYCLIPAQGTSPDAVSRMTQLVKLIGANPLFIDAAEHDAFVAGAELLPIILSCAWASVTTHSPQWNEMSGFVTDHSHTLAGLTASALEQKVEACLSNMAGISRWLDEYIGELQRLRNMMGDEKDALRKALLQCCRIGNGRSGRIIPAESLIPSAKESISALFLGERLLRRTRKFLKLDEREPEKHKKKG